ncbi:hypothetical protein PI125_g25478 [Phytophthora idaei]|nr:hypothetical protein PI125_g25478 [Phytophthora idaei]
MEKIPDGQTAQDRPDIVARVWQLKLGAELKDLDEGALGRVHARIYAVEFQKRGLPHTHILVILAEEDKPRTRQIIDNMMSAELPDKEKNPQLYETVTTCMIHGPCGAAYPNAVCMKDGKCTKSFPKPLSEVTKGNVAEYPVYRRRRRAAGVVLINGKEYDNETINQWVVPYNPYISQKYNCHINVEVCTAIAAVKYLYKYVYKGSDKAVNHRGSRTWRGEPDADRAQRDLTALEREVYLSGRSLHAATGLLRSRQNACHYTAYDSFGERTDGHVSFQRRPGCSCHSRQTHHVDSLL